MIFGYLVIRMRRVCDVRAGRSSFVLWPQNVVSHLACSSAWPSKSMTTMSTNFSLRIAVALKFEDGKDRLTRSTFCDHSNHGVHKRLARIAFCFFVRSSCVRRVSGSFGFIAATDRDRQSWRASLSFMTESVLIQTSARS